VNFFDKKVKKVYKYKDLLEVAGGNSGEIRFLDQSANFLPVNIGAHSVCC